MYRVDMALTGVRLAYGDDSFTLTEDDRSLKGELVCDCRKSELIRRLCNSEFPVLRCGTAIELVAFEPTP
jgi:hypothetical protein